MKPYFSIIMPVTLAEYKHSAKNRKGKFIRAVKSVLRQTFDNWELIIISDGCNEAVKTFSEQGWDKEPRLSIYQLPKQPFWNGVLRNTGIEAAKGDWVIYLDSDDIYLSGYLNAVYQRIQVYQQHDWYIVNEYRFNKKTQSMDTFIPKLGVLNSIGTCNLIHKRGMQARWSPQQYGLDDYVFAKDLKKESIRYKQLDLTGYFVCHIPKQYDV